MIQDRVYFCLVTQAVIVARTMRKIKLKFASVIKIARHLWLRAGHRRLPCHRGVPIGRTISETIVKIVQAADESIKEIQSLLGSLGGALAVGSMTSEKHPLSLLGNRGPKCNDQMKNPGDGEASLYGQMLVKNLWTRLGLRTDRRGLRCQH